MGLISLVVCCDWVIHLFFSTPKIIKEDKKEKIKTKSDHKFEFLFIAPQRSQVVELIQLLIYETKVNDKNVVITATPKDFNTVFQFMIFYCLEIYINLFIFGLTDLN